jgi:hypothetical protein
MDEIAVAVKIEGSHRRNSTLRFWKRRQLEGWLRISLAAFRSSRLDEPHEAWTNVEPHHVIAILER